MFFPQHKNGVRFFAQTTQLVKLFEEKDRLPSYKALSLGGKSILRGGFFNKQNHGEFKGAPQKNVRLVCFLFKLFRNYKIFLGWKMVAP